MFNITELKTKSNQLSILRLLLAIPIWFLLDHYDDLTYRYITFAVCLFASITDILDGYLARKYDEVTEMGKIIDPLADKIAIGAIIIKLYLIGVIPPYYFLMIIARDLIIFFGGIIVAKKLGRVLPSNMLGKITVTSIGIVILLLLLSVGTDSYLYLIFYYISIFLIVASLIGYTVRAIEFLKQKRHESI